MMRLVTEVAVTGFVLAGGRSTRMGTDKAALPWEGTTLLDHMVALLSGVASEVYVVGRDPLPDREPGRGPLEGVRTALAVTTTDHNLILAVDMPFLRPDFLRYLTRRHRTTSHDLLLCRPEGRAALCFAARRSFCPILEAYLDSGQRSLQGLAQVAEHDAISEEELARQGFDTAMFYNLNTVEDYERARGDIGV